MPAAKATPAKATASKSTAGNAASKACTAIVSYKVNYDDVDNFLNAYDRANDFLKKQSGHVSSTLHRSMSSNAPFRFVNVAKWKTVEDFRRATQSTEYLEASSWLDAYPVYAAAYDTVRS